MEKKELQDWIMRYKLPLEKHMEFGLASISRPRMPRLIVSPDEGSWTDGKSIHIGLASAKDGDEETVMRWARFLLGHEMQHVLSTTDKAWKYGLTNGYHAVCEELSKYMEKTPRRFRKEDDYSNFLKEMPDKGFHVTERSITQYVHFVVNSLEDGRIERLRIAKRPGFKNYMVPCRAETWQKCPVSPETAGHLDDPRTYLTTVLNQVLTLATTGIYQKGFIDICGSNVALHKRIRSLVPHIRAAVAAPSCRKCMDEAIIICRMLGRDIVEASRLSPLEELLSELLHIFAEGQGFTADSRTEETGDGVSVAIAIFGGEDALDEKDGAEPGSAQEGKPGNDGKSQEGGKAPEDAEPSEGESPNGKEAGKSKADGKPQKGGETNSKSSGGLTGNDEEAVGDAVEKAAEDAEKEGAEDIESALRSGYINRKNKPKAEARSNPEDAEPDASGVNALYGSDISFKERKRTYRPDEEMPAGLYAEAETLKRKVKKIFRNMEKPQLKCQKSGRVDAGGLYKVAMNQMDFFERKQQTPEFDGCCYILQDNSGSMGNGKNSKRYHCCRAVATIEHAFSPVMPLKVAAFDAEGCNGPRHEVIKNWHENVPRNGAWNFYVKGGAGYGNKDGYSIRMAASELLSQPQEKKILFVLSDGLPSDYKGGYGEGCKDVKNAVKQARKNGIAVIAVYFGPDDEEYTDMFREMYDRNYIITEPEHITEYLIKNLKRFCFK